MDNNDNICSICYESLENDTIQIECGHKYHTNCIVKWFRTGHKNCPLCNDTTIDVENISYFTKVETIKQIKNLGRRKNCPNNIKKQLDIIKKHKIKKTVLQKQLTDFKKQHKHLICQYKKFRNDIWKQTRIIHEHDYKLLALIKINPIYIK